MGLYNFKLRFVPFILAGTKTHTIRELRRYPDKPGNTVHLYTGLRTKHAKLLMRATCVGVQTVVLDRFGLDGDRSAVIRIDDVDLDQGEMEALAVRDGFADLADMMNFWKFAGRTLPWRGQIIHWRKPK
jgi:uncharacterized protein YqfB (UPF0267 family)